jgi:Putative bacterial sensory transduction regulator
MWRGALVSRARPCPSVCRTTADDWDAGEPPGRLTVRGGIADPGGTVEGGEVGAMAAERDGGSGRPEPEAVQAAARAAVEAFLAETGVAAERLGDGRWFVRLAGERKLGIGVHVVVGDRTLRVESFFMRAPEEHHAQLYRDLLLRQAASYVLRFTLDEAGDLFLVGQVPLRAVTAAEVDRVLGTVLEVADAAYLPSVATGFASSIAAERAWRARLAAPGPPP